MTATNLTDHFLIAMPSLVDSCFEGTLTYICDHSPSSGAMGVVVNKPLEASLSALLQNTDVSQKKTLMHTVPLYFGGPVQVDHGFVLHRPPGNWESTMEVNKEVGLTTSTDILRALGSEESRGSMAPGDYIVTVGYAGWSPGQLEDEICMNSWLSVRARPAIMFDIPFDKRLKAAMELIGVSPLTLSSGFGRA